MPRPGKIRFTEKKHSRRALLGMLLAAASLGGLCILVGISMGNHGTSSAYIGSGGLFFLLVALAALYVAVPSLKEENSFPTLPRLATLLSVLACLSWIGLYAWGFTYGA